MSFRRRLIVLCGLVVALIAACALLTAFLATRARMLDDFDDSLREQATRIAVDAPRAPESHRPTVQGLQRAPARPSDPPVLFALVFDTAGPLPAGLPERVATAIQTAGDRRAEKFIEVPLSGAQVRFLVSPTPSGVAVVARPLDSLKASLRRLAVVFLLIASAGVLAVAVGVSLASRRALRPVAELTAAAERIAAARAPTERIDAAGDIELVRLADAFNAMLDALEQSLRAQRQLVADASHELRTPVTAVRANVELLLDDRLPDVDRERVSAALRTQVEDLSGLVADVVEVASAEDRPAEPYADLELHEVVEEAVERARRSHPGVRFYADLEPTVVRGDRSQLLRAVTNILNNAARFSPDGGTVTVTLRDRHLRVCDQGPGVAAQDRAHIFERFYRSPHARTGSGHGLGLAIVAQVAKAHGATPTVDDADGGGACIGLRFSRTTS